MVSPQLGQVAKTVLDSGSVFAEILINKAHSFRAILFGDLIGKFHRAINVRVRDPPGALRASQCLKRTNVRAIDPPISIGRVSLQVVLARPLAVAQRANSLHVPESPQFRRRKVFRINPQRRQALIEQIAAIRPFRAHRTQIAW
jgi:hypothetical protein